MRRVPISCNKDCGAGCALIACVESGSISRIIDNPARPTDMVGCTRGYHAHETSCEKNRIRRPLIRTGPRGSGDFREAKWDEALELVASRLAETIAEYGGASILGLAGSGSCRGAVHNTSILTRRFLSSITGGRYTDTFSSYSSAAQSYVLPFLFGTGEVGIDPLTLEASKLIVLWGANVVDTRFGADLERVIRRVRGTGVRVIVIDPRRSRTVERLADEWITVRPGTDAALMSAVLHTIIESGNVDRDFTERYTTGFGDLEEQILRGGPASEHPPATPEWAERISGVPADAIRALAHRIGTTRPTALISGLSIQRTIGGEEAVRLATAIQAATGNIGIPGGAPGCCIWNRLPNPRFGTISSGATGLERKVPVYRWADAVLESHMPGATGPPIKAIYAAGVNYAATGSDIGKSRTAFSSVEFSVCHDLFLTPTARLCDVVLPVTTFLERSDVVFPAGNYLFYSAQAIDPVGEARNDFDMFADLAMRLGAGDRYSGGMTADQWLDLLIEESEIDDIDSFKTTGIYDGGEHRRIAFAPFRRDPDRHPLPTPSGRIELSSAAYADAGGPATPRYRGILPDSRFPLLLVTPHARYRINSQNANLDWARTRESQRLTIHPVDATTRGIEHDDTVVVESGTGTVGCRASVDRGIMPGVVSLPAGMWPAPTGSDGRGGIDRTGAANYLTSTEPTSPSMGSRTHTVFVDVRIDKVDPSETSD